MTDLVLDVLLPQAAAGLDRFGVAPAQRDRLLGIIEERCRTGRNGAVWQTETVRNAEKRLGHGPAGGAAPHAPALHRAPAHQRAGAHLGLSGT